MTNRTEMGENSLVKLRDLQQACGYARARLVIELSEIGDLELDLPTASKVKSEVGEFLKLLNEINRLEHELEKNGSITRAGGFGVLDCRDAKSEILDRLSRIRRAGRD